MPYYDFECKTCVKIVETTDPSQPVCTGCGSVMVRIYSAPPIHFKGSGFYSTGG